ncbi:TonB-dependent receptor [Terriglobus tenax]|uniref:TonB-dependent receptor n=1 Tax=Terriglobus tenax TaxID=1111115 RepID=UPI0021DFF99A|nr:carboxypeptidase-like regulatory domain-containing protein [Terriglobus tenax]
MTRHLAVPLLTLALAPLSSLAQAAPCTNLTGVVADATAAVIPGAAITLDGSVTRTSGQDGRFVLPCVARGSHQLAISYSGFATVTVQVTAPHAGDLSVRLVAADQTTVTVNADDNEMQVQSPGGANGLTIAGNQLQALADDPDDLLRQLQQMAAAAGGSPSRTTISVDGFQDDAKLPPKSSIAFINVSPDLFSAEYREPPFGGGRVEVYTKPGAKNFHGALYTTNSSSWMNARNPFTVTSGTTGKQRYGFDLSGPVRKQGSNFSLSLEHRNIDEIAVVNAVTLSSTGDAVPTRYSVPRPQALWNSNARVDWQMGPKNIAFITYAANANNTENAGVGGSSLLEAGYGDRFLDQYLRFSNVTTINSRLMHEARVGWEHFDETFTANSIAPSIQVSGYFTGGGASTGNTINHRNRIEYGDDIIATLKRHTIKTGFHLFYIWRNSNIYNGFNGSYTFTSAQSYLAGNASLYSNVSGNPNVRVGQVRFDAFYQDDMKLRDNLTVSFGLRYFMESDPATYRNFAPRAGLSWSPDKKKTWQIKTHAGVFNGQYSADELQELYRQDGTNRVTSLIYNPVYGSPFNGTTPIHSKRTLAPNLTPGTYLMGDFSVSKDLPGGFNINADLIFARFMTYARTVNINQPLDNNPYGVRPITPNLNILQVQYDGTGRGHGEFFGLSNFKSKRGGFFLGALHLNLRDDTNDGTFFQPQSAYTDAGEQVRRDNQGLWQVFGNTSFNLPGKFTLSGNIYGQGGQPFNVTTGSDNNGDGNFNDRPQYAAPGAVANGTTVFQTPFGLLTNAGSIVNGIPLRPIRRNIADLPWNIHLDANLQRTIKLTHNQKADHPQTLTVNLRSANFINHTNVTGEGSVLGSPQFLVPNAADTARRIEFGLRYNF